MQLKKPKAIRGALATATCALLGTNMPQPAMAMEPLLKDWEYESALLYYTEQKRVTAVEPVISGKKDLGNDQYLTLKFVVDSLSGASANGAVPTNKVQTFGSPSGQSSYTVAPNETPLDPTFQDTRFAGNVLWEKPTTRQLKALFGASFSSETDYSSLGVSGTLTYDANNKNTTFSLGASYNRDSVSPTGGTPQAFTPVPTGATGDGGEGEGENEGSSFGSGNTKNVSDLMFGITQILSRQTLMQLNYSYGKSSGYLTDPYKLLSVVDSNGDLISCSNPAVNFTCPTAGDLYLYEKRPDSRIRQSVYWKINHQFTDDVAYLSYRYYWDDWGIKSHTVDLHYRYQIGHHTYLQPHLRYYKQTAANFYHYFLLNTVNPQDLPDYASADYRLGAMTTKTIGLLYGAELSKRSEFTFRAEYIQQSGDSHPAEAVGKLRNYDLFPTINAYVLQLGYNYKF